MPPSPLHFEEIHLLNQVYIQHPYEYIPDDICPREEIASPAKLARVVDLAEPIWEDITLFFGHAGNATGQFKKMWMSYGACFHEGLKTPNFVEAIMYHVLCENERLFTAAQHVRVDDSAAIFQWLREWGNEHFVITTPLMMYHGHNSDIMFGVSYGLHNQTIPLLYSHDTFNQLINHNCYTLGNGLILALAMERAGKWRSAAVCSALRRWLPEYTPNLPASFIPFFTQHNIPHISEYPALYACMGARPCSRDVVQVLKGHFDSSSVIQYFNVFESTVYTTSATTASFPYFRTNTHGEATPPFNMMYPDINAIYQLHFPQGFFLGGDESDTDTDDDQNPPPVGMAAGMHQPMSEDSDESDDDEDPGPPIAPPTGNTWYPDLTGFLMSVLSQRSTWRWWNTRNNASTMIRAFNAEFSDTTTAYNYIFKRLFQFYQSGTGTETLEIPRSRIQTLWRQWIAVCDPNGEAVGQWVTKYVFGRHLRESLRDKLPPIIAFGAPLNSLWNPAVPICFLKDLFLLYPDSFPLYKTRSMQMITRRWDTIMSLYPSEWQMELLDLSPEETEKYADPPAPRKKVKVRFSLYKLLGLFPASNNPERCFKSHIDRKVLTRLTIMNKFFMEPTHRKNENKYAQVWDMMKEYYRTNRMQLAQ